MSELPVVSPATADQRDSFDRYRSYLGKLRTLVDRRAFWVSADRELVAYENLRKGERRARRTFWRLLQRGMKPVDALWEAAGLCDGPIPELHKTEDEFRAVWTESAIHEAAERWKLSRLTQRCAAAPVRTAVTKLEEAGPDFADTLIEIARNKQAKDSDRRAASRDGLLLLGVKLQEPSAPEASPFLLTGNETTKELEILLLRVAQKEPDTNRARLMTETIHRLLEAKDPQKWGKKLTVESNGGAGLAAILLEMDARRDAALADHKAKAAAIPTTAQAMLTEADPE